MNFLLAVVLSVVISVFGASSVPQSDIDRVSRQARSLKIDGHPFPGQWTIVVPTQEEWDKRVRDGHLETVSAFTYLEIAQTYLNPRYVHKVSDERLRHTLAHEAGHLSCLCANEDVAEKIAEQLEK